MFYAIIDFNGHTGEVGKHYMGGILPLNGRDKKVMKNLEDIRKYSIENYPNPGIGIGIYTDENDISTWKIIDDIRWKENPEKLNKYIENEVKETKL